MRTFKVEVHLTPAQCRIVKMVAQGWRIRAGGGTGMFRGNEQARCSVDTSLSLRDEGVIRFQRTVVKSKIARIPIERVVEEYVLTPLGERVAKQLISEENSFAQAA